MYIVNISCIYIESKDNNYTIVNLQVNNFP